MHMQTIFPVMNFVIVDFYNIVQKSLLFSSRCEPNLLSREISVLSPLQQCSPDYINTTHIVKSLLIQNKYLRVCNFNDPSLCSPGLVWTFHNFLYFAMFWNLL